MPISWFSYAISDLLKKIQKKRYKRGRDRERKCEKCREMKRGGEWAGVSKKLMSLSFKFPGLLSFLIQVCLLLKICLPFPFEIAQQIQFLIFFLHFVHLSMIWVSFLGVLEIPALLFGSFGGVLAFAVWFRGSAWCWRMWVWGKLCFFKD